MLDNTDREGEEALFENIRSPRAPDNRNEEDDGSQYVNNTGEGEDMISIATTELMKSWIMMAKKLMIMMATKLMIMMAKKMLILINQRPARYIYKSRHLVIITCFK